jgi:hypothetical protein
MRATGEVVAADLPQSRADATVARSKRYFDGRPCPAGHTAARYTLNGYCVECQRLATRADRARVKQARL